MKKHPTPTGKPPPSTPACGRQVHGGTRIYSFSYAQSTHADGYNHWKYKTVETLPGGDQNIIFSNYAGQTMLAVAQSGNDQWFEFYKYDETTGHAIWQANSSAVSGYDQQYADLLNDTGNGHQYLKDNDGLIHIYDYDAASGQVTAEKIQRGEQGTPITIRQHQYIAKTEGETTVYLPSKLIEFPDENDPQRKIDLPAAGGNVLRLHLPRRHRAGPPAAGRSSRGRPRCRRSPPSKTDRASPRSGSRCSTSAAIWPGPKTSAASLPVTFTMPRRGR